MDLQRSQHFLDTTVREPSYSLRFAAQYREMGQDRIGTSHILNSPAKENEELKKEQLRHMGKYEKCIKLELLVVNVFIPSASTKAAAG